MSVQFGPNHSANMNEYQASLTPPLLKLPSEPPSLFADTAAILTLDSNGIVRAVTPCFCALVGRTEEELVASHCAHLFTESAKNKFLEALPSLIATNRTWAGILPLRHQDQSEVAAVGQAFSRVENGEILIAIQLTEFRVPTETEFGEQQLAVGMMNSLWRNLPGIVCQLDEKGLVKRWNSRLKTVTGYDTSEIGNLDWTAFFSAQSHELVSRKLREASEFGNSLFEAYLVSQNSHLTLHRVVIVHFEVLGSRGYILIATDISDRQKIEESLHEKNALFEAQVESSLSGILMTSSDGKRIIQNQRLNEMWNIPQAIAVAPDLKTQLYYIAAQTKSPEDFLGRVAWLNEHPDINASDEIELIDGRVFDRQTGPVLGRDNRYYGRFWTHRDITSRKEAEKRIRFLATHDSTTSLPNRNMIQEKIAQQIIKAFDSNQSFALLFLDLDRFKVINDGYGHAFGDAVLQATAKRLSQLVGSNNIVARYGGDEFLILISGYDSLQHLETLLNTAITTIEQPLVIQEREIFVSASVGVSIYPQDGNKVESLIGNANLAMYRAKDLGRNNVQFFNRDMAEEVQNKINVETRLRSAAANGHLSLVYQPKVSLENGCITGCEALLRWTDPELGTVSPIRFIPIAEESGLIVQLGDWALRTACLQAKEWMESGLPPICVAVNVSARQFLHQNMYEWVMSTLKETGLPPELLEIELTESLLAQDVERALHEVKQLRDAGVKFSIDDFGTGYSSLSYLNRFRIDTLKIDQSFVRRMLTKQDDANIVRAIISLAHSLGFRAIAEGVETEEHCHLLRQHGCEEIQGYYFSRPIDADEFQTMVLENRQLSFGNCYGGEDI